ncbi:MAG: 6-phosphogluconolactonase [Gemmobacter sp.]
MKLQDYPDRELMFLSLADRIAGQLADFLRREGRASLCVPGGTTPGPVFDTLSGVDLDWANVAVFPGDERRVPEDDPRSNARLIRGRLLTGPAAAARFVPLSLAADAPQDAVAGLAESLAPHLPISVLLLGMGGDMHVASLFPGGDNLAAALAADAPVVLPMHAPGVAEPRLTLSARVLAAAMHIHILITGPEKRDALERAATLPPEKAPVRALLDNATVHWAE